MNLGIRKKKDSLENKVDDKAVNNDGLKDPFDTAKKDKEESKAKKVRKSSSAKEIEFYNSLTKEEQNDYDDQQLKKKETIFNVIMVIVVLVLGFLANAYINSIVNGVLDKNDELRMEADSLQTDIKKLKNTEELLEDVAISGQMSKAIFEQRDEILDLLESVEAITPNNLTFKLNKIQRLGRDIYKVDYELIHQEDPKNLNKPILDTAFLVETYQKSKVIMSQAQRDKRSFVIQEFKGSNYSKSTGSYPVSMTVLLVEKDPATEGLRNEKKK